MFSCPLFLKCTTKSKFQQQKKLVFSFQFSVLVFGLFIQRIEHKNKNQAEFEKYPINEKIVGSKNR